MQFHWQRMYPTRFEISYEDLVANFNDKGVKQMLTFSTTLRNHAFSFTSPDGSP